MNFLKQRRGAARQLGGVGGRDTGRGGVGCAGARAFFGPFFVARTKKGQSFYRHGSWLGVSFDKLRMTPHTSP